MAQRFANTQDLVPIEEIMGDTVIAKGGKMMKIIMVAGINFLLKSEEEQKIITYAYQEFLNSLEFPIQIIIHSRKINIENYLSKITEQLEREESELLKSQIIDYREFIKEFVAQNPIMTKVFFVVVSYTPATLSQKQGITKLFPFFKTGSQKQKQTEEYEAKKEEVFRRNLIQLEQRTNQVLEGLSHIGLDAVVLGSKELVELFYNFYNPETVERQNVAIKNQ